MKEHVIVDVINLILPNFCLYWNQFSIAEYMQCQLITTQHFSFSQRFVAIFVLFFNWFLIGW